jgi:excisionase family DNA binding protein
VSNLGVSDVAATPPRLMTAPRAAEFLGLSNTTVRRAIATGQVPSVVVGKRRLIPGELLQAWLSGGMTAEG